jgi:hypothetical protein
MLGTPLLACITGENYIPVTRWSGKIGAHRSSEGAGADGILACLGDLCCYHALRMADQIGQD